MIKILLTISYRQDGEKKTALFVIISDTDGRKLALDQRLVNDMLPDEENSKSTVCKTLQKQM